MKNNTKKELLGALKELSDSFDKFKEIYDNSSSLNQELVDNADYPFSKALADTPIKLWYDNTKEKASEDVSAVTYMFRELETELLNKYDNVIKVAQATIKYLTPMVKTRFQCT